MTKLYHFHRINDKFNTDELYHEGAILEIGKEYNTFYEKYMCRNLNRVKYIYEKNRRVEEHLEPIRNMLYEDKLNYLSKEELICLIMKLDGVLGNYEMDKRETALEKVRELYYPERPSRYKCMWLTDEDSLVNWYRLLANDRDEYELYRVEVDGNLFVSTNTLLPDGNNENFIIEELAHKYWNPSEEDIKNAIDREYLFEGQARLVKRVK